MGLGSGCIIPYEISTASRSREDDNKIGMTNLLIATVYVLDMAAAEAIPFPRTDTFSSSQAENFWQMRNDGTYTDFTIHTKDKAFQVNIDI